ncbi:MAG: hypothetical protein H6807_03315 [Planctomycetes bacterium]|nr:hypothetical protein [Planctomycetota bacterium]
MTRPFLRSKSTLVVLLIVLFGSPAGAQSLSTSYLTNNNSAGAMFDIKASAGVGVLNIDDFDLNCFTSGAVQVDIWAVSGGGSFIGHQDDVSAWTLLASTVVTSSGIGTPTNLGLALGLQIPAGSTQGFFIYLLPGGSVQYITRSGAFDTVIASDGNIEIRAGIGKSRGSYPAAFDGPNFGGFTPGSDARAWSGTVHYSSFAPAPTPGQAPRPGQAVFDVNDAVNANAHRVTTGEGGPYFSSIDQGSAFVFHFEGGGYQPIALLYGALNPLSATFPGGIGQFDIGGPGVDPQGLPVNIGVFANGIAWSQATAPPLNFDALFFTNTAGVLDVGIAMPPFGLPAGTVLTTFQAAILSSNAPFVYISNAIQMTLD